MPSLKDELLLTLKAGIVYLLNPYEFFRLGEPFHPRSYYTAVNRLQKDGLIRKFRKEKMIHLQLTKKGQDYLRNHAQSTGKPRPAWDHKWRVVIFDIPEEKAQSRNFLRRYLISLGFGKVQRSIWISPYNMAKQIELYARKLKISDYVFQLSVERFQGLPESKMGIMFWDIKGLDKKYLGFIGQASETLIKLHELKDIPADKRSSDYKILLASLNWDYQSILALDPQLPAELLPSDWSGKIARRMLKKCELAIR
jgi:phenylacetic acid degradation operon negative regulatory protein